MKWLVDMKKKTISILDKGIGMSAEEIKKYINQIAFSGATEFVEKYVIVHFFAPSQHGLGARPQAYTTVPAKDASTSPHATGDARYSKQTNLDGSPYGLWEQQLSPICGVEHAP